MGILIAEAVEISVLIPGRVLSETGHTLHRDLSHTHLLAAALLTTPPVGTHLMDRPNPDPNISSPSPQPKSRDLLERVNNRFQRVKSKFRRTPAPTPSSEEISSVGTQINLGI